MVAKLLTSFEVLSLPVAPGIPNVPYVQQGFFLQITNLGNASSLVSIEYNSSPPFQAAMGAAKLFANFIDGTGLAQQYPANDFLSAPVGFEGLNIPSHTTWLIGVQYLLQPPPPFQTTPATGGTPQDSIVARGSVTLNAAAGTKLLVLATVRQVFNNYDATGKLIDIAEGAYSVPLIGGPQVSF